jgi:uncharacterized protein involved in exopolysaccharide biosynthesis
VALETHNQIGTVGLEPLKRTLDVRLPEAMGEYTPKLSLRTLIEACFRHRIRLLCVAGLPVLFTLLAILFMPKRYQATMQLAVLNTRQYSVISSESDQPAKMVSDITDSDVNSQAQLLRSREVLNQTLDQLGRPATPVLARDRAIDAFDNKLDVAPVRESNILNVSYIDSSPAQATETLQALASSFVGKELSILRPMHGEKLFVGLVEERQRDLKSAQDDFAKFKVETGIASLKDDEAMLLRQLEGLSSQSASLTSELALEKRRAEKTDAELARHPERITTQNRSTPNQAAIESLTSLLVQLQNKRTSLLTGYEPTERIVRDIEAQINNVENQLSKLRSANAVETTTDMNPLTLELKSQLARSQISGTAIAAQRSAVEVQKQAYLSKLNQLEGRTAQFDSLQKRVQEAQTNLDLALQKRDQAAVDDALDKDRILNVAFAAKPSASSVPVQPRPALYLALGLFIAAFLGVGTCVVTELGRNNIQSPAELDAITGLTTLACVPLQTNLFREDRLGLADGGPDFRTGSALMSAHESQVKNSLQPFVARSES